MISPAQVTVDEVVQGLHSLADPAGREGMARFGINTSTALGIKVAQLRPLARQLGRSHELAGQLWDTGVHEARILASMVEEPRAVTQKSLLNRAPPQADDWITHDTSFGPKRC